MIAHPSSFIEASRFIFALFYVDVISKRVIDFNSSYFISTYPALILLPYRFSRWCLVAMISFEIALNVSFLLIYANIVTLRSLSVRSTQFFNTVPG